jgi:hypothetical protein
LRLFATQATGSDGLRRRAAVFHRFALLFRQFGRFCRPAAGGGKAALGDGPDKQNNMGTIRRGSRFPLPNVSDKKRGKY